jgi:hypothetical protein
MHDNISNLASDSPGHLYMPYYPCSNLFNEMHIFRLENQIYWIARGHTPPLKDISTQPLGNYIQQVPTEC